MQAFFSSQVRSGPAPSTQLHGRVPPSAPGGSNIFTSLSLASAFASTTVSAQHTASYHAASSAFSQLTPGLLPPPVGPGAQIPLDHMTRNSMSTRHFRTASRSRDRQTSRSQSPRSAISTTATTAPGAQASWSNALGPTAPSTSETAALKLAMLRDALATSSSRAQHASVAASSCTSLPESMFSSYLEMSSLEIYSAANFSAAGTPYGSVFPHPKAVRYKFAPATLGFNKPRVNSLDRSPSTRAPLTAVPRQVRPRRWHVVGERSRCCDRWERPALPPATQQEGQRWRVHAFQPRRLVRPRRSSLGAGVSVVRGYLTCESYPYLLL